MTFQLQPEVPVFVGILLVAASLLVYSLRQYHRRGRTPELRAFIVLLFVICVWQLTAIFINVVTVPALIFAGNNFGNVVLVPGLFYSVAWFALAYTENTRWVNRWTAGVAVATIGVLATAVLFNPTVMIAHDGLTTQGPMTIAGVTFSEWVVLDLTLKPAFRGLQLYGYVLMIGSGGVVVRYLLANRSDIYRGQAVALAVGIGAILGVNSLLFAGLLPPEWNLTHVSFGVTAVAFAVAIFRYRLLAVAPIGRKQLVEQLADPVVMLDDHQRVAHVGRRPSGVAWDGRNKVFCTVSRSSRLVYHRGSRRDNALESRDRTDIYRRQHADRRRNQHTDRTTNTTPRDHRTQGA